MRISIIAAMTDDGIIGKDNRLPWHLPADLKHFRALTLGKPVVMGRRTWESLQRPLPGRTNIVLTSKAGYRAPGAQLVNSLEDALAAAAGAAEIMIIGGARLYEQGLPLSDRMYLTLVHAAIDGDTRFPSYAASEWHESQHEDHVADANNPHDYSFLTLERMRPLTVQCRHPGTPRA
jgi:dihydrofolate reductase